MPQISGAELRITSDSKQGGRKYMEDVIHIHFEENDNKFEYAFFAVYDGHGGPNAAQFAKEHLLEEITKQKNFWSNEDTQVLKAIKDGFISCHRLMWKAVETWPKTLSGLPSTSGTTASVVFIRNGKVYCAHVGDSGVVLGVKPKKGNRISAHCITVDHKPESPKELKRIKACGGNVVAKAGVNRVVWDRPKQHNGPLLRSTEVDHIPFLAVARALGDLWSYNSNQDVFVVSPEPDVCVFDLDVSRHKSLVLASDGLWNMVRPQDCVDIIHRIDKDNENLEEDACPARPANTMVRCALDRWTARNLRADNTSVVVVMIDSAGERRERSASSASTVSINSTRMLSESEDEMSESELSDSDLIDSFAPDIDMDDDSDTDQSWEEGSALPCFGGVGLKRTPPCGLTTGETKPRLRRLGSLKRIDSKVSNIIPKITPRKPIYRPRLPNTGSAPSKLIGHGSHFRGICKNSPFARSRIMNRPSPLPRPQQQQQQQQSGSNASFMDPGFKAPMVPSTVKTPTKCEEHHLLSNGASPTLVTAERTLRPKSPRLIGENLLSNGASGSSASSPGDCHHSPGVHKDSPSAAAKVMPADIVNSPIASLNFSEPKEATSPKSPVKTDSQKGSPSAGLVSPIWPSSLGVEVDIVLNGENVVPSPSDPSSMDNESTENIERATKTITPKKLTGLKRKSGSPIPPKVTVKRLKSSTPQKVIIVSPQKSTIIRTRGQLKSLSPYKNSSPRKNVTPRKTNS